MTVFSSTVATSPAASLDWLSIDNVYTANLAAATQEIQDFLNSYHNTWNLPSPVDSHHASPTPASIFVPGSPPPFINNQSFLNILADVAAQELACHNLNDLIVELTHPAIINDKDFAPELILLDKNYCPISPIPDNTPNIIECCPLATLTLNKDIPVKNLLLPILFAAPTTVPSPALLSPRLHTQSPDILAVAPTPPTYLVNTALFPYLFKPPACAAVEDQHPHQFHVIYKRCEKIWVPARLYRSKFPWSHP